MTNFMKNLLHQIFKTTTDIKKILYDKQLTSSHSAFTAFQVLIRPWIFIAEIEQFKDFWCMLWTLKSIIPLRLWSVYCDNKPADFFKHKILWSFYYSCIMHVKDRGILQAQNTAVWPTCHTQVLARFEKWYGRAEGERSGRWNNFVNAVSRTTYFSKL